MDPPSTSTSQATPRPAWKLLLVDAGPAAHAATHLALCEFRFDDRPLELLSATSEPEARQLLASHDDIAVVLHDGGTDSEQPARALIKHIRDELGNRDVRIVVRTRQTGQALPQDVIGYPDIDDIADREQSIESAARRLRATLFAALQAWRDIKTIQATRRQLERVVGTPAPTFSGERQHGFQETMLAQLDRLVAGGSTMCMLIDGTAPRAPMLAGNATGKLREHIDQDLAEALPAPLWASICAATRDASHRFDTDHYVLYFPSTPNAGMSTGGASNGSALLFLGQVDRLSDLDRRLLELFAANLSIALKNLDLTRGLTDAQMEMIFLLGGGAESRSQETAAHVARVGLLAELLAREYGLDEQTCERIRHAAPLHDIGKTSTPANILNKEGFHTPDEVVVMRQHAFNGHRMLAASKRPMLQLAASIALTHHERWDGSGYPNGLRGDEIPISGRITMLADVFDALGSKRCYKEAWPSERVRSYIVEHSGRMFDPDLVEILLRQWGRAEAIRSALPD